MRLWIMLFSAVTLFASCSGSKKVVATAVDDGGKSATEEVGEKQRIQADRLFFDAIKNKMAGDTEEAKDLFNQSLRLNPENDAAYWELARIYLLDGSVSDAEKQIDKAIEYSPDNKWYLELKAEILSNTSRLAEAAEIYKSLYELNPKEHSYGFAQGELWFYAKEYDKALGVYQEMENELGSNEDIIKERLRIYMKTNRFGEAETMLNELQKKNPNNVETLLMLGDLYNTNEKPDQAIPYYEKVLSIEENNVSALVQLADIYLEKGNQERYVYYSGRAFSSTEVPIDAKIAVLYNYIENYEVRKNEMADAFKLSEQLLKTHPEEAKAHAIAGDLRYVNEDLEDALEHYKTSLSFQQDVFTVWQQVFFILTDLKDYNGLLEQTEKALVFFPNHALVYFFNGLANHQLKEHKSASSAYERALRLAGGNRTLKLQLYSNLGDVYQEMGDYEKSDERFEQALALDPNHYTTLNNYAYFLSLRGERLDDALAMVSKATNANPKNASFLDTHAWVLFKKGDYSKALEWQQKAIDASPEVSATLWEHLGDILYHLDRKQEAKEAWNKALGEGSKDEVLQRKASEGVYYEK